MSSARLALADGSVFEGRAVGASGHAGRRGSCSTHR